MTATRNFEIQEDGHLCWHSQNGDRCQLKFEFEFEGSNETLIARTRRKDADLLLGAVLILKDTDSNRILVCKKAISQGCLLYTSPSPRDQRGSRMPSSA